jgi:hypothetical protein
LVLPDVGLKLKIFLGSGVDAVGVGVDKFNVPLIPRFPLCGT